MASVPTLVERYRVLVSKQCDFETDIEEQKQKILEQILVQLAQEAPPPFRLSVQVEEPQALGQKVRKYGYYALLSFGVLEDLANSYFMGSALFLLMMPNISSSVLFIASLVYAFIEGALFYLFDSYELRVALNVDDPYLSLGTLLNQFEKQVTLATTLNLHLAMMSTLEMSDENYQAYLRFLNLVSLDLEKKLVQMQKKDQSLLHQVTRLLVTLFGAISSLAGSYFMVTTLLSLVCFPILTTSLGLAIIVLTMALGLVFHYCMDSTSLTRAVNPEYEKFQSVKEALSLYQRTYANQSDALLHHRARYKPMLRNHTFFQSQPAANHEAVSEQMSKASRQI